ncbi:hypothetical protein GCM10020254_18820 [Streptomyces goshikiensis]
MSTYIRAGRSERVQMVAECAVISPDWVPQSALGRPERMNAGAAPVAADTGAASAPDRVRPTGTARVPPSRERRVCRIGAIGAPPGAGGNGSDQCAAAHRPGRVAHANPG